MNTISKWLFAVGLTAVMMLTAIPVFAVESENVQDKKWIMRVRGILLSPQDSSGSLTPGFPTGSVDAEDDMAPEIDFTYMISKHFGLELILATTKHIVKGDGSLSGVGTIADARVLPPTLTLQYHLFPDGNFRPYVGAGINYTIFYNEGASQSLEATLGQTTVDMDSSVGFAAQAGVDIQVAKGWFFNLDVKYVDLDTTITLKSAGVSRKVNLEIDPIIFGVGIGVRF